MQLQVTNSPFNQEQTDTLNRLLPTLTEAQKTWLGGYLAAQIKSTTAALPENNIPSADVATQSAVQASLREVTILFGSETGNAQTIAEEFFQKVQGLDFPVTLSSLDDFKQKELKKVQDLFIVTATHGEGDPPDNALSFHEFLHGRKAPKLKGVRFSVLSLGDQSYEFFCQTGKDFDKRLEELGGERLYQRADCDVDYEEEKEEWIAGVLQQLRASKEDEPVEDHTSVAGQLEAGIKMNASSYSKTNPFKAEILENIKLNGRGSNKETRHLELSLEGSNLSFEPGDSLGIYPENDPILVDNLIDELNWDPEEMVPINKQGETCSLRDALLHHFEITRLTKPLLEKAAKLSASERLKQLIEPEKKEELNDYLYGRDLLDLVRDFFPLRNLFPWRGDATSFISILRKLPPRLYSIASSYKANPDEVHLTIGTVRYDAHDRERTGVCSGQCAERTEPGDLLPIYIHRNPNFKSPADPDTPLIMVGPGTGIAPFRSFLEEREEIGATGKTWLFFGEQHFQTDFLYQVEWQNWLKEGVLTQMDVAFSRDTAEKVYVQHRMLEKSKELYQWLEEGASLYVCGDEKQMANDVHHTLLTIIEKEGNKSLEEAEAYLQQMKREKRYQRDVY